MKKITRRFLLKYGLFNPIDHIYSMSKTITPNVLYREIQYRIFGTPDGYAIPPSRFIYLVDGIGWVRDYYVGGKAIVENILKHLEEKYIDIYDFEKILDFGCGSGRLVRHFAFMKDTELYGCDYNKELINWCKKNLNLAKFQTNNMKPPIDYADNMFDFVYLRSVFTHLGEEMQNKWMKEFGRILKPGGILHFTTHGSQFLEKLNNEQKKKYEAGELISIDTDHEGTNQFGGYQSLQFVVNNFLPIFELIAYIPGGEITILKGKIKQDLYFLRKRKHEPC